MKIDISSSRVSVFVITLFTFTCLSCSLPAAAEIPILHHIRLGQHSDFIRLVFDIQGLRPAQIDRPPGDVVTIAFPQLKTRIQPGKLVPRSCRFVSRVTFQKTAQSFIMKISLRPNTHSNYFFLDYDPPRAGWYRLVMDFSAGSEGEKQQGPDSDKSWPSSPTSESPRNDAAAAPNSPLATDRTALAPPASAPAADKAAERSTGNKKAEEALYEVANHSFLKHQDSLPENALAIVQHYEAALKAAPESLHVPLALYRSALAYNALGDLARAEKCLRRVIVDYPQHPCVRRCWLNIGRISQQHKSYIEAIEAFRTALTFDLKPELKLEAYYELGKCLSRVDSHQEAIDSYQKCLAENPKYYLEKPDILKSLGESFFALQQYDKSCEHLFHYLNLQNQTPDRDMILARIAEIFQRQGKNQLADKLHQYIERTFPESEGCVISKIRKAELLEQQNETFRQQAQAIYQDLAKRPLSPPLAKLVFFKLASWQYEHQNYQKSLALIDDVLRGRTNPVAYDEFLVLRKKVILDWMKQAYTKKNYVQVIELFKQYQNLFRSQNAPDLDAMVAESYAELKDYPRALQIYQSLLSGKAKPHPDWLFKAAQYSFLMKDLEAAKKYCAQIRSDTLNAQKTLLMARINYAQQNYQDAAVQFDRLLHKNNTEQAIDLGARIHYAESLINLKRYKDALTCLEQASRQLGQNDSPERVRLCVLQSQCQRDLKQPHEAIKVLEKAISLTQSEDQKDQLNYQLSALYIETGQLDRATARLSQLLQSSQPFWKIAAQQKLDYLKLQDSSTKSISF